MPAIDIAERFRDAIPLNRSSGYIPGNPHCATVWRWATKGVRGVKLATIIVGGRRMVTPAALEEFLRRLNAGSDAAQEHADANFARRAKEAGQALEKLGC